MSEPRTTEREVFRAEAREGQYVRLIACGKPKELLLDGLEQFIAWRRRLASEDFDNERR